MKVGDEVYCTIQHAKGVVVGIYQGFVWIKYPDVLYPATRRDIDIRKNERW